MAMHPVAQENKAERPILLLPLSPGNQYHNIIIIIIIIIIISHPAM